MPWRHRCSCSPMAALKADAPNLNSGAAKRSSIRERLRRPRADDFYAVPGQQLRHPAQILFRIDPNGVIRRLSHMNRDAIFEKTQLLQPLGPFERRLGQCDEAIKRSLAVRIKSEVLEIRRPRSCRDHKELSRERNKARGRAVGHHLHGIWIGNIIPRRRVSSASRPEHPDPPSPAAATRYVPAA